MASETDMAPESSLMSPDLRDVQGLLDAIAANSSDALFVRSVSGIFLFANAASAEMLGASSADALIGRRADDILPKEIAQVSRLSDEKVMNRGEPLTIEGDFGGRRYQLRKSPWRDAKGRIIGIIATAREVSADQPSAALVRESQAMLDLAQEAGQIGLFEWQVQAGTLRLSANFLSLYGLTQFDGRYESWLARVFREDRNRIIDLTDNLFAQHARNGQIEFRIVKADDGAIRWMEARNVVFYDAEQRASRVVGVNVDITERKRAALQLHAINETLEERVKERTRELRAENEARRTTEELLRQSQKMEAVGQLTGGVAHDFNNLLTIVLGGLQMIERQLPGLERSPALARIARGREMAAQGAHRAATLTQRLLAFSRQQPLEPKPLDANKLVAEISELLRRTLGEGIALETVLAGGLWTINADANQLENAILNLAVNARDASPTGGKVEIETANCHLDEAYITSLAEPVEPGQYIMIAVADTGIGMDPVTVERVFEPFFTTKGAGKGTGLGLSQVYGFVRQSGGHVKIYSEVGEGTTVKLYLPRHLGEGKALNDSSRSSGSEHAIGTETILVVEDDDTLRAYGVDVLSELGYRVLAAPNGAAALEALDRNPDIDLLFTDIIMPGGINGRQLADEALRRRPGLKVLFTTGYTRNAIVHHGRLDSGVQLISKPFSFDDLAAKVRAILDQAQR